MGIMVQIPKTWTFHQTCENHELEQMNVLNMENQHDYMVKFINWWFNMKFTWKWHGKL